MKAAHTAPRKIVRIAYEAAVIVIGVFLLAHFILRITPLRLEPSGVAATPQATAERIDQRITLNRDAHRLGKGKVLLLEFADYQCPFCVAYAKTVYPRVNQQLIASNRVDYVSLHFPLDSIHQAAFAASEAAECAGRQNRFREMRERLFGNVRNGTTDEVFLDFAEELGLDRDRFRSCMQGAAAGVILQDVALGKQLGVRVTPQFFLGLTNDDGSIRLRRRFIGFTDYDSIEREVDALETAPPSSRSSRAGEYPLAGA